MAEKRRLLTISEAADRLGVNQKTLRAWADKGIVPVVKLPSGYRRFAPEQIDRIRREMGLGERSTVADQGQHEAAA